MSIVQIVSVVSEKEKFSGSQGSLLSDFRVLFFFSFLFSSLEVKKTPARIGNVIYQNIIKNPPSWEN